MFCSNKLQEKKNNTEIDLKGLFKVQVNYFSFE